MGDKYEDLGPANVLPPPPPLPGQFLTPAISGQSTQDRTELKSAPFGAPDDKGETKTKTKKRKAAKKAAADDGDEGEEVKYTSAQVTCMVISGIIGIFCLITSIAAIVILVTGYKIFS